MREEKLKLFLTRLSKDLDFFNNEEELRSYSKINPDVCTSIEDKLKVFYLKGFFYDKDGCKGDEPTFKSMNSTWKAYTRGKLDSCWFGK